MLQLQATKMLQHLFYLFDHPLIKEGVHLCLGCTNISLSLRALNHLITILKLYTFVENLSMLGLLLTMLFILLLGGSTNIGAYHIKCFCCAVPHITINGMFWLFLDLICMFVYMLLLSWLDCGAPW